MGSFSHIKKFILGISWLQCSNHRVVGSLLRYRSGRLCILFIENGEVQNYILNLGLWCFGDHVLVVKAWDCLFNKSNEPFVACYFYAHLVGLTFECHTTVVGRKICGVLGCVKEMQICKCDRPKVKFLTVHFSYELLKPIRREIGLQMPHYGPFKGLLAMRGCQTFVFIMA